MVVCKKIVQRYGRICVVDGRLFTKDEVDEINTITVKQVILAVTNIPPDAIQNEPFFLNG